MNLGTNQADETNADSLCAPERQFLKASTIKKTYSQRHEAVQDVECVYRFALFSLPPPLTSERRNAFEQAEDSDAKRHAIEINRH